MFAGLQVGDDLLSDFREVAAFNEVVRFQEDGAQARFPNGVVLEIELIKTMERIGMGLLPYQL